jgi:hypothetical protein
VKVERPSPPKVDPLPAEKITEYTALWQDLVATHLALDDVRSLKYTSSTQSHTEKVVVDNPDAGVLSDSQSTRLNLLVKVDPASFKMMRTTTLGMLGEMQFSEETVQKPQAIQTLNSRMMQLSNSVAAISDPRFLDYMPPQAQQLRGLTALASHLSVGVAINPHIADLLFGTNVRGQIKPLGIGDLKVVKQKLQSYQLGEVAHIENVLRGEYKERKYRVLDRTEQMLTESVETQQDTTKDTQTTERFELKKESENTIQEQMSVQAGVTVSGSYGVVTFGAHGDFAYSTSSQESTKNASNFAREVVDRSITRIQKHVKTERVTKQLHEVEQIDTHGIDNKGQPDNLAGVYRWVDKYYEAQIYNYGKRMMLEFIVPEPSAFVEYSQTHQPKKNFTPPTPLPTNLTHKDITEWNYHNYIRAYQVQGCTPPPSEFKVVSQILSSDAQIANGTAISKSSKELVVPEGYVLDQLGVSASFIHTSFPLLKVSIGKDLIWMTIGSGRRKDWAIGDTGSFDGIIPIGLNCYDINSYFVSVMATCTRTWQKYEAWQISTFEKIVAAYQMLKAGYEQQVAAQETRSGVVIHGKNPRINREIEKTELKKSSVKLLMDDWQFGSFDAMKQVGDFPPDFDIFDAISEGKVMQFFEQAFEWENLTYLFYPYFWGRNNQWVHKINTYDEDPLFTKFLQSGAARVVVPVHPAYCDAIMYFLENNGAIWNGGEPPRLNDPLFISLAEELRGQTDDLQNATPEGPPWQVILPTTLVYLQKDSTLPTFS